MNNSKWNYMAVGWSVMGTILGAVVHNAFVLLLNLVFAIFNWYVAEAKRQKEDEALIAAHELLKSAGEKTDD